MRAWPLPPPPIAYVYVSVLSTLATSMAFCGPLQSVDWCIAWAVVPITQAIKQDSVDGTGYGSKLQMYPVRFIMSSILTFIQVNTDPLLRINARFSSKRNMTAFAKIALTTGQVIGTQYYTSNSSCDKIHLTKNLFLAENILFFNALPKSNRKFNSF